MTGKHKLVGFGILFFIVWLAMALMGRIGMYVDIPSLLLVSGIVIGGLWVCFGPGVVIRAVKAALSGRSTDPKELATFVAVMGRGYQLAWGAGIIGTLLDLIAMLANLSDPSSIGAGRAVGLLTVLYGAFLAEVGCNTLQQLLLNQCPPTDLGAADNPQTSGRGSRSMLGTGASVIMLALVMFCTLLIALSEFKQEEAFNEQSVQPIEGMTGAFTSDEAAIHEIVAK